MLENFIVLKKSISFSISLSYAFLLEEKLWCEDAYIVLLKLDAS